MNTESQTDRITQLEASCAAMRQALIDEQSEIIRGGRHHVEERRMSIIAAALSTDAGKSLLERLQAVEAERDRLRIHVIEFLNDWKKGDFQLSELAACDARAMEEALQKDSQP